ncbi:MAG: biopolymer transport protein ExbD [Candidatus Omnitrophota bacterium]|jgi:biopolymer transport protein ExbD
MKVARKKKSVFVAVPVAAMGDIAFLLIIFFMIAATFAKEQSIELEAPGAVGLEEIEATSISVTVDKEGVLRIEGQETPVAELDTWISALMQERETELVRLKIDKHLTRKTFGPIFSALSEAGAKIAILGEDEE